MATTEEIRGRSADVAVGKEIAVQGKVAQENQSAAQKSVNTRLQGLGF